MPVRLVGGKTRELLEQSALLMREVARNRDVDEHSVIAASEALQDGHPLAAQDAHFAGLRSACEIELEGTVERFDRDRLSERGLDDVQIDRREDVVALPHEARIGTNADPDVHVPGAPAELARMTLAADADLLPVVDARRNRHREPSLLDVAARAVTRGARGRHDAPCAPTARTRLGSHELAEHAPRDLLHAAGAVARGTCGRACPGLGAVPAAALAGDADPEGDVSRRAARSLDELDVYLGRDVRATCAPPAAAEEVVAEERGEDVRQAAEVE